MANDMLLYVTVMFKGLKEKKFIHVPLCTFSKFNYIHPYDTSITGDAPNLA